MATFKEFRNIYRTFTDTSVWALYAFPLTELVMNVYGAKESIYTPNVNDLDMGEYLIPELVIYGFMKSYCWYISDENEREEKIKNLVSEKCMSIDKYDEIYKTYNYDSESARSAKIIQACFSEEERTEIIDRIRQTFAYPGTVKCKGDYFSLKFWCWKQWETARVKSTPDYFLECKDELLSGAKSVRDAKDVMLYTLDYLNRPPKDDYWDDDLWEDPNFDIDEELPFSTPVKKDHNEEISSTESDECDSDEKYEHLTEFEKLSLECMDFQKKLMKKIKGQDIAVRRFSQGLFNGRLQNDENRNAPKNCFLFVGPPGVGKTLLAKTAAEISGKPCKVFNMSEYAHNSGFQELVGFASTWRDAKRGYLTGFAKNNPEAFLIFDEIEKAHINTIRIFLSMLEGGTVTEVYDDKEIDFRQTTVIFTTNAGRKFYEEKRGMSVSSLPENTLIEAIRSDRHPDGSYVMPPEILSRLSKGNIVGFDHMTPGKLIPIIKEGIKEAFDIVKDKLNIDCEYNESLLPYLFLYHMGNNLDARIASARSRSFVTDTIFHVAERAGDDISEFNKQARGRKKIKVCFDVKEDEISRDLTIPTERPALLVICNTTDRPKIRALKKEYDCYYAYAEKEKDDPESYILQQLRDRKITAILIDPFMRGNKESKRVEMEGIVNKDTVGNRLTDWILEQGNMPPVYCMELNQQRISDVDRMELKQRGVKGILPIGRMKNAEARTKLIADVCYERFLSEKLEYMASKGRALNFECGHRITGNKDTTIITLSLYDFRLVRSMDPEASDLFVPDDGAGDEGMDSVVGQEAAKEELRRFIRFIRDPERYRRTGQQVSRGILMYGPPGSGKTKLARALANEADCPFISATGTQFVRGEKNLSDVFRVARKYAPSILFIDEIESFALDASTGLQHIEILKQLLTEMDGFEKNVKPVFVIAATNAAKAPNLGERNVFLDETLLRRFTKRVYMKWPDRKERIEFMNKQKKSKKDLEYNLNLLTKKDIEDFADLTAGHSLSEMENVLELAIGRAAEMEEKPTIELLTTCFEEFVYGEEHKYAKEHVLATAIHESGHAFMGFYCAKDRRGRFAPEYATIISRGGYLGMVRQKSDEDYSGYSKDELLALIRIKLAGRAAELVFAKDSSDGLTTGASNDLQSATYIVAAILSNYGMEEGFLAALPVEMMMKSSLASSYYGKLNSILKRELDETVRIITENKAKVKALADALIDRSRLDTEEMKTIIGEL